MLNVIAGTHLPDEVDFDDGCQDDLPALGSPGIFQL